MEDLVWDSLGRDCLSLEISRDKQQTFSDGGQKYLGISYSFPGQN